MNSSDDDDDVPLSKLKMLRSMSHEIVNNENTVSFTSDAESTGIKSNGECRTVKVTDTEPYYIRAVPTTKAFIRIHSLLETPLYT